MEARHLTDVGDGESSQHSLTLLPSPALLLICPLAQAVEREGQGLDLGNLSPKSILDAVVSSSSL